MSFHTNLKLWQVTKRRANELQIEDEEKMKAWMKKGDVRDIDTLNNVYVPLFLDYCAVVRDLGIIMKELVQIQLRENVKTIYVAASARLCELKDILCTIALSQFIYLDDVLIERRLTPQDIQIVTPEHLKRDVRDPEMQALFDKIMAGFQIPETPLQNEVKAEEPKEPTADKVSIKSQHLDTTPKPVAPVTNTEDTLLKPIAPVTNTDDKEIAVEEKSEEDLSKLPKCERERQERIAMKQAKLLEQKPPSSYGLEQRKLYNDIDVTPKVIKMQSFWRGYSTRKRLREEEIKRQIIMGMLEPTEVSDIFQKKEIDFQKKKQEKRDGNRRLLNEFTNKEEVRIFVVKSPQMMEDITDEIIEWFDDWYQRAQWFDKFPEAEDGGSVLIVTGQTQFVEEFIVQKEEKDAKATRYKLDPSLKQKDKEIAKKQKKEEKAAKKLIALKEKNEEKARKKDEFPINKFQITDPLLGVKTTLHTNNDLWGNVPLEDNPEQTNYFQLVTEDQYAQLNIRLRSSVDELMRIEHQLLVAALNKDRKRLKLKPQLKFKAKKKKGKKKKKGPKDLTENRSVEDLFQELVDNGIIHSYPSANIDDFIGDWNFSAYTRLQNHESPPPSLMDVVASIKLDCILSMGSPMAPRPKGILLISPPKSGKKFLINVVLNETGSVLFDLTPQRVNNAYPGSQGVKMLTHLVIKLSTILQPAIIFVDGAEKPFYKKIPPEEKQFQPKQIGKVLKKLTKQLKPENKVLLLSCSNQPFVAKRKPLLKTYEKIILFPRLDYGSCYQLWRKTLMAIPEVSRDFNISILARATTNYQVPYLRQCLQEVIENPQKCSIYPKSITPQDVLQVVLTRGGDRMTDSQYAKYQNFYNKSYFGAKMIRRQNLVQESLENAAKLAKSKAKKKVASVKKSSSVL